MNEISSIKSDIDPLRRGYRSKLETKAKLEELKKQMEMDFDSKYQAFKGIDQSMRISENKLRNLLAVKRKNNQTVFYKGNISEETAQSTLDQYSELYSNINRKPLKKVAKEYTFHLDRYQIPLEVLKLKDLNNTGTTSSQTNLIGMKIRTIATHPNRTGLNFVSSTTKVLGMNTFGKSNILSFN